MLSPSQLQAVHHKTGPAMVLAGPGSGKTMVITNRVRHLTETGIPESAILVITFTRAAALQMRQRYLKLCDIESTEVTFGTFHAVFFQILKHAYHYSAENIMREEERYRILSDIQQRMQIECEDQKEWAADTLAEISEVKSSRIPIDLYYSSSAPEEEFRAVYRAYEEQKRREQKIDFDDMCLYTLDLFRSRKDILQSWQRRFPYIMIDEFQDIDPVQYEIIRMLAKPGDHLFIVGDDDQSIYRFRGARPEIMLNFGRDYPSAEIVRLEENYRSTANIVSASLRVINQNQNRYRKNLRSVSRAGDPVSVMECRDTKEEYLYLVKCIRESLAKGIPASEIAVLTRTNLQARGPAEKLTEFGLPVCIREHVPIVYDHFAAQDFLAYLRLATEEMRSGDLLRVCNRPNRYISRDAVRSASRTDGTVSMEALKEYYADRSWMGDRLEHLESDLAALAAMRPYAAVNYIRNGMGYDRFLEEYAARRRMNLDDLKETEEELQESAKPYESFQLWNSHIEEYRERVIQMQRAGKAEKQERNGITLATLHASKGLEFKEVFLLDVNEGMIPYRKAVLPDEIEEERRLFYVGMTRAKERLHLLFVRQRYDKKTEPSRFLDALRPGQRGGKTK